MAGRQVHDPHRPRVQREHRAQAGLVAAGRAPATTEPVGDEPVGREAGADRVPRAGGRRRAARRCRETWRATRAGVELDDAAVQARQRRRAKRASWPAALSASSGAARCVHRPPRRHARLGLDRLDERAQPVRAARRRARGPSRPRRARRAAGAPVRGRPGRGGQRPLRDPPGAHASPRCAPRRRPRRAPAGTGYRTRIGSATPASRSSSASSRVATESPSAPAASSAQRDRDGAVPVGVGLDDGLDADARARRAAGARRGCRAARRGRAPARRCAAAAAGPRAARRASIGLARRTRGSPRRGSPAQRSAPADVASAPDPGPAAAAAVVPAPRLVRPRPEPEPPPAPLALGELRQALAAHRQRVGQVAREQAGVADPLADEPRPRGRGGRRPAARRRTGRGPARAARRSSRRARRPCRRVAIAGFSNGAIATDAVGRGDDRPGALEHDDLAPLHGGGRRRRRPARRRRRSRSPSSAGTWPLPARSRANSPACGVRTHGRVTRSHQPSADGERAQRLRVEHDGPPATASSGTVSSSRSSSAIASDGRRPGPDDERVVLVVEDLGERGLGVDLLDVVLGQRHRRRLDDLGGEQRLERLGHGERHEAGAGAPRGATHEQRRRRRSRASRRARAASRTSPCGRASRAPARAARRCRRRAATAPSGTFADASPASPAGAASRRPKPTGRLSVMP